MKKNKISKNWIIKQHRDPYFKESKIQGYKSRSAFKLIEMNEKFRFLNKNTNLLDLGSSPGGWSQVSRKKIVEGKILAIDINEMEKIPGVNFLKLDINDREIYNKVKIFFLKNKVNAVISDMAANTSGNKSLDSYRTGELCLNAMELAVRILNKDGVFLSKVFMGSISEKIDTKAKNCFKKIVKFKPLSSKKESKEIYIFCKGILKYDK